MKYTVGWQYNGKRHQYYGKSMSTNFPGSPHTLRFVEYYWEPISQALPIPWVWLSFPVLWKLMRKHIHFPYDEVYHRKIMSILWENYEYQFTGFSPYNGFCCIFPWCGELLGKPMYFPYNEVYHRMGI